MVLLLRASDFCDRNDRDCRVLEHDGAYLLQDKPEKGSSSFSEILADFYQDDNITLRTTNFNLMEPKLFF